MFISLWRTFFLYVFVSVALRFMGKRQIGELQPSELVTTIMISNIAAVPIENTESPLINALLAVILLACMEVLFSALALKSRSFRGFAMGHARCVIRDGILDEKELRSLRWSLDDLMELLRTNGIFDIDEVLFAVVETNGSLSTYPKHRFRPVDNGSLNIAPDGCEAPPMLIISDGNVDFSALSYCRRDKKWLDKVLASEGLKVSDIFAMSCDRDGKYKIFKKEKR